ncbi:MAG: Gfo/Idh/MocA family oxidoreductase [Clostridiales Family XIII bacterium]|jgi:predicted dehydrogenase|nr:Gfo/Idh/MocA family oxidoreductase [Clostridiales Family XIII bacterium]
MNRLRFAMIGCGRISRKHVEALAANGAAAALAAVCDIVPGRAAEASRAYAERMPGGKAPAACLDYRHMLGEQGLDAVAVCVESGRHAEVALDCLRSGLHVLVEKPMALSSGDAEAMISLAGQNGLRLGVCHQNRFNPPIQRLRRALDEGRFGKLVNGTVRVLWNRDAGYYSQAPWRGTWKLDGGTLMNQCIHGIDLLQWMMGGAPETVMGMTGRFLRDIEAEDFGAAIMRFGNGSIGIVEGSACVYPENLEETLGIFGETGAAVIGGMAVDRVQTWRFADLREYDGETRDPEIIDVYGNGHSPLYADFISAVRDGRDPYISGKDGKIALDIVLRVYAQEGHSCG